MHLSDPGNPIPIALLHKKGRRSAAAFALYPNIAANDVQSDKHSNEIEKAADPVSCPQLVYE
jgi:hypothetical protein